MPNHLRAWVASVLALLFWMASFDLPSAQAQGVTGQWTLGPDLPWFPVHDHVLPDGRVMMWPGDGGVNGDDPRVWDPATGTGTGTVTPLARAGYDVFCTGHSFLPDGRLFVAGGHVSNGVGLSNASVYHSGGDSWQAQPRMNLGRWYPTTTVLANGDVLVVSGDVDGTTGANPLPQVWQAATGTWRSLTSANLKQPLYPYMFLAPDGRAFDAGPGVTTRLLNTSGTGAWSVVGNRTFNASRDYGGAVMYAPGKILTAGGSDPPTATAEVINLGATTKRWTATGSMNRPRRQMNLTMLPDGKVLATGGTSSPGFSDPTAPALMSEMWDPTTGRWTDLAGAGVPRLYHSVALLLPDGRVLSTGGNGYTQSEIYSPPYLFAGARPTISSAPAAVGRGQSLVIGTPDAGTINAVAWVRLPSVTHTNAMSQGFFRSTAITPVTGGVQVTAPSHTSVPSGHYMLFVLRNGVPSVARIVHLGPAGAGNPVPALSSLAPATVTAGSPAFTLTVNGSNFTPTSVVRWNGANRATTVVSGTQLRATIPAADVAAAGTAQVTVANPAPGGGVSGPLPVTISSAGSNPVPTLTAIAPTGAAAGGPGFTLTVTGSNFVGASRVRWNGSDRPTTVVSVTQLTAAIPAADIATAGTAQVTVVNPTPGGGTSAPRTFAIDTDITGSGTPIARVTAPIGGGSHDIGVIRDGVTPPVGSADSATQYDTYDGNNTITVDDWIGYQFAGSQTFKRVRFQEGRHFFDGGWFTSLRVQVRQGGVWQNVAGLVTTPAYPGNNGITFESFDLQFTPTTGDAVRIAGDPGGSADFISVGELRVLR